MIQKQYRKNNRIRRTEIEAQSYAKTYISRAWGFCLKRARKKKVPICTRNEFAAWNQKQVRSCVYCGMSEQQSLIEFAHRLHIDRKESNLGYITSNMQLACHRCNVTKNKYLTHEQMHEIARKYFRT